MFQRENIIKRRPLAATYLCRKAAKARFDNRPQLEGVSKEGGPQPSLFGRFKGKGFLRKGGNRNPPFLKPFFGYFLSGKKVTRQRQKRKKEGKPTGGAEPRPYTHLSMACAYTFRVNRAARPYALKCRRASPKSPSAPHFPKMQIIFYCGEKKPLIS